MLASTMQHSTHNHTPTHHRHHTHPQDARDTLDDRTRSGTKKTLHPGVSSGPNSVPSPPASPQAHVRTNSAMFHPATPTPPHPPARDCLIRCGISERRPHPTRHPPHRGRHGQQDRAHHQRRWLLRKEVIQPHLPVRLPCYDFVPIASPTFDDSLPQGVGPSASGVTDFRDVTGGVYKARERIHRSVADLRLLATPTSRGRVADPDPN